MQIGIVEDMRARMAHFRRAPARPRQAVEIALDFCRRIRLGAQRHQIKLILMRHMRLQAFRRLTRIARADRAAIDFTQDAFGNGFLALHLNALENLPLEADRHIALFGCLIERACKPIERFIIILALKNRLHHLIAPLHGTIGSGAAARTFKLRADRQQIGVFLAVRQHREGGRMRVRHYQQIKRFQPLHGFRHTRDGIAAMAEHHHGLQIIALLHLVLGQGHGIEIARCRNARRCHHGGAVKTRHHAFIGNIPNPRPMPPGVFIQPVIGRQRRDIEPEIRRPLHIAMAAEDIRPRTIGTDIAGGQQQNGEGAHIGGANGLLRGTHAPNQRGRLLRREHFRDLLQLRARHTGYTLNFRRVPFGAFGADFIHAIDALADEFLIFPAIGEDVVQHAPNDGNIGARTDAYIFIRMRRGAGEARVNHNQIGAVLFLACQHMLQADRVRFRRIAAHDDHGLGIADVVIGIGLRAITPGIGNTGHRGGMANARLMVDVIRAPEGGQFAIEISAFIGEFGAAQPEHAIGAAFLAGFHQLVANFGQRIVPGHALPLAIHQLHRVFDAPVAMHQFTYRCALGAMRATIDGGFPSGFLAHPNAILHFSNHGAANGTMGADILHALHGLRVIHRPGFGGAHGGKRNGTKCCQPCPTKPGLAQKGAAIEPAGGKPLIGGSKTLLCGLAICAFDQHGILPFFSVAVTIGAIEGLHMRAIALVARLHAISLAFLARRASGHSISTQRAGGFRCCRRRSTTCGKAQGLQKAATLRDLFFITTHAQASQRKTSDGQFLRRQFNLNRHAAQGAHGTIKTCGFRRFQIRKETPRPGAQMAGEKRLSRRGAARKHAG